MAKRDFLFELGTEELPPKSLFTLARALAEGVTKGLAAAALGHGEVEWFATPRRLAVRVHALAERQPDQEIKRQGPAVANAFDASGQPTKAAAGFAASCGVSVEELQQVDGPKGRVLHVRRDEEGRADRGAAARHRPGGARCAADRETHALGRRRERVRPAGALGSHVVRHDGRRLRSSRRARREAFARTSLSRARAAVDCQPREISRCAREGARRRERRRPTRTNPQRSLRARAGDRRPCCHRRRVAR